MSHVVLVVDDDPLVLVTAAEMLMDLGCEVITATNGNEALEQIKADQRIRSLITDIHMPGMDGYELVDRAREARADLKAIVVSGRGGGRPDVPLIRKPFTGDDLASVMSHTTGLC
jgi:CheY-like chemotaxis protein